MQPRKPSGVGWIGDIPADWEIIRLKYIANVFNGNSLNDIEKEKFSNGNQGIPYISTKDVEIDFDRIGYDNGIFIPFGNIDYKIALKNNTIICIEGGNAGRKIGFLKNDVCFVNKLCCFEAREKCISKYIYYYTKSKSFSGQFNLSINGLIGGVSIQQLKNFFFILPPNLKQQEIVYYLDAKCEIIDNVIEKQKTVIEKLKSYKHSLITETVTKGLDPTVKMKPSGIEWIGDIPKDWEVKPIFIAFKERKCRNAKNVESNLLSLSYGNIIRKDISDNMGLLPESFEGYNIIEKDNIVFRLTDLQNDHVSLRSAIALEKGIITSAYVTLESIIKICARFYYYLFRSYDTTKVFYNMGGGVRQSLNYNELKKIPLIIPSLNEQIVITDYLNAKCSEIDSAINGKQKLIDKLIDYKKSLIYECVTGKKEIA